MKNPLHYIQEKPHRTKQILGITNDQFRDLLRQAEMHHQHLQAEIEANKIRRNQKGGGRKPKLQIIEEICLSLFDLRQMPTFEVLGLHFGISKTEANDTFHYWLRILRKILPASLLEQVKEHDSEHAIAIELLTEFQLIVDSMEQPRERPSDQKEQKEYFSGKKRQHTFKNQFVTLPKGKGIVDVEVGEKGPTSDVSLFREQQEKFDTNQMFEGDKAYQGGKNISTPQKKPRKGELTEEQKTRNKEFSSKRIFIEHVIRLVKIFRVAQQRFPLQSRAYEQVILTICGLVRLRIGALVLPFLSIL
ncbi:transposase family protein [Scytonema sp. PRP1]|uniref:transposase family protein n=1 Tax=Scytonema sp. PRP1 TaxID=3120513 RepID=UPI00300C514A